MTKTILGLSIGMVILCLLVIGSAMGPEPDGKPKAFAHVVADTREAWGIIEPAKPAMPLSRGQEARTLLTRVRKDALPSERVIVDYLVSRTDFLIGQGAAAEAGFRSTVSRPVAPESIMALIELTEPQDRRRLLYTRCLADLLPVSFWRGQVDGRDSDRESMLIKPPRPDVPTLSRKKLVEVGELLENAGQYDLAWRAYVEAVYAGFSQTWIKERLEATWLSPEAATYWYKAAVCAHESGRSEVAWDYLTKAAVFGSDALYRGVLVTAKEWESKPEAASQPATGNPVDVKAARKALAKVVRLYQEMNMHPRAWALIDASPAFFDDPDKLRKEIKDHWVMVIKDVSRFSTKVVVYGQEVYPTGDPLRVGIPWALSDEAFVSVRKRLAATTQPER